jgi:hypothetical protein
MRNTFIGKLQIARSRKIYKKLYDSISLKHYSYKTDEKAHSTLVLLSTAFGSVLFLVIILFISACCHSVLGQVGAITQNEQKPLSSQGNLTAGALLEKISDKGNYRVQLMWNESSRSLSNKGFDMEIDFLNASAPLPTANTVPQKESNIKGESSLNTSRPSVPSIIQPIVPVDSYDITIYSDQAKVLWKKINQPVMGGRGLERITFVNGNYTGGITIQISNIKSASLPPNSATFTARVVG